MVLDRARNSSQETGLQLSNQKGFLRRVVFAADAKVHRRREAEARVIPRVPQDYYCADGETPAMLETSAHESRANASPLVRRCDSHRREAHDSQVGMARKSNGREKDVANDSPGVLGHQGHDRLCLNP